MGLEEDPFLFGLLTIFFMFKGELFNFEGVKSNILFFKNKDTWNCPLIHDWSTKTPANVPPPQK